MHLMSRGFQLVGFDSCWSCEARIKIEANQQWIKHIPNFFTICTDNFMFYILQVTHEDFNEGIIQVQAKKKASLNYYA